MCVKQNLQKYCILALTLLSPMLLHAEEAPTEVSDTAKGQAIFDSICSHCHQATYDESPIGAPGLQGVLERHDETWINNWIQGPEAFAKKDVAARDLIDGNRFGLAMPTLPAMQDEGNRRAIIEYLKTLK